MEFYLFHKNFILKLEILEILFLYVEKLIYNDSYIFFEAILWIIAEQNNGGKLILQAVSKLKDSEQAVVVASKQLAETEERVREAIRSLAL